LNTPQTSNGPDYSAINSADAAEALVAQGHLVRLLLLPEIFGGEPLPQNIVYVPPFVQDLKASIDQNIILPLAQEGKITKYAAEPAYSGASFIPVALHVTASEPGSFNTVIRIWGEGLVETS
jgi:hypothetical protein